MQFAGEFETHLTIAPFDTNQMAAIERWAMQRQLKFLHIVLDRGDVSSQPMLTWRNSGVLAEAIQAAFAVKQDLERIEYRVTRVKIEAALENQGVPQSDDEALRITRQQYFENHIKLLLASTADILPLKNILEQHNAHLSRNVLQVRSDGLHERFVTQRCFAMGAQEAERRLQLLVLDIRNLSFQINQIASEFVVYDSNIALDRGWLISEESSEVLGLDRGHRR